jgi:hypothetical protein
MAESKKPAKRIIDVQHADKAPTSPTSKPVIVTNRPILQDPMVVDKTAEEEVQKPVLASSGATIQPLSAPEVPGETTKKKASKETPKEEPAAEEEMPEAEPAPEEPETPTEETPEESSQEPTEPAEDKPAFEPSKTLAEIDAEVKGKPKIMPPAETGEPAAEDTPTEEESVSDDQPASNEDEGDKGANADIAEEEKQAKKDAELQKLVDNKQYFLPINSVEKRRSKQVVVIGILLSLILIVAWVDIALDAGLIEINGVKPITHFFSS